MPSLKVFETHQVWVSVAQSYWNPQWSEGQNQEVYGALASPHGVGANLRLQASQESVSNTPVTRDLEALKVLVDHRFFREDFTEFQATPSTLETITIFMGQKLFQNNSSSALELTVWETPDLACTVRKDQADLLVKLKVNNLWLTLAGPLDTKSRLLVRRETIFTAVRNAASELKKLAADPQMSDELKWSQKVLTILQSHLSLPKGVSFSELRIDLGRHKYLTVRP